MTFGYIAALLLVGGSLVLRWAFAPFFGDNVPYLQFFPAIMLAAWYGGFGPGVLATAAAALAALYFFLPPDGFALSRQSDAVSLALFVATGVVLASLNGRLRAAQQSARVEADKATTRAERLSAIINTTVDGIIVIDARGLIESLNAGAQRLFGYAEAEVLGKNVSMLMPAPFHD